jgi:hypothetical protein
VKRPTPTTGVTEVVRVPAAMAEAIRDIAHAERRRVAEVLADLLAKPLAKRLAGVTRPTPDR